MSFTHLHAHTEYSILDGSNKIKDYIARVKELGMDSAAITDHGVMYGVVEFYKEAIANAIKPIIGCEVYVAPGSRLERKKDEDEKAYYHLILLAENNAGYQNLIKIVSAGFVDGFYYKPRVDMEILEKYHDGIICLSACLAGEIARKLSSDNYEGAKEAAFRYEKIFGKNNYFLEIQDHGLAEQKKVNASLMRLSNETGIPLVATNDCHYTYAEDEKAHEILLCLQTKKKLSEEHLIYPGGQYYVKSEEEMRKLFPYAPDAVSRSREIAERCNVEIKFHESKLPKYDTPEPYTSEEYLEALCENGFAERYPDADDALKDRLAYELSVIKNMGYVDYFLIVWDFINYAKERGIAVGPGRGSAAGSVVAYCLKITDVDPIKYDLLFERFLNPERVSMPDIDVDFCVERRNEVISYVMDKYGKDCVTQIVTFGTLGARSVIRDVGRVMDFPYSYTSLIAKTIPEETDITIDKALESSQAFKKIYDEDDNARKIVDMAKRLEGIPRNTSMHAAGVIIASRPMDEYIPLSKAKDGTILSQFDMTTVEELGLLKMDFLGLRNLTVIQNTVNLIKKNRNVDVNVEDLDMSDPQIFKYISSGKVDGVFQLESSGMKSFMKELKPSCLEDIIAGISLYRPGPMDFIDPYIEGKNNPEKIVYDCPQLEPILKPTYGCIVYQEQVMQIVRDLAGYSLGRSDLVRRAMSKKKASVMEKERKNFVYGNKAENIPGCVNNGIPEEVANKIYDEMIDFAKYAFNKSHAAAYAFITYQTAWLKYYYPVEYYAALMTSKINDRSKSASYVRSAKESGINVLPPDINRCEERFSVDGDNVIYGLGAVKNVGAKPAETIVTERDQNGPYKSLNDFCERIAGKGVNKRAIGSLICAGAFDCVGITRKEAFETYENIVNDAAKNKNVAGQMSFLDFFEKPSAQSKEWEESLLLDKEHEVLDLYLSGHPLDPYEDFWKIIATVKADEFIRDDETGETVLEDARKGTGVGMVSNVSKITTKKGQQMAFLTIEDFYGSYEVIVFPNCYEECECAFISTGDIIIASGKISVEDEKDAKLIADTIIKI